MFVFIIILQLIATIAVIVFIFYTVRVHRHINEYLESLEKVLKDHEVYLSKEITFRNNITEIANKCTTILSICSNTNYEVINKLRNIDKDKDNKYNALISSLNTIINLINVNYNVITEIKNKAKFSYNTDKLIHSLLYEEERNTKLKTAKKPRIFRDNGGNRITITLTID